MDSNSSVVFFLQHVPDVDQAVPIIDKWLKQTEIPVDIVLYTDNISKDDYRLRYINRDDAVSIYTLDEALAGNDNSSSDSANRGTNPKLALKRFGKQLPTNIPKKLWRRLVPAESRGMNRQLADRLVRSLLSAGSDGILVFTWCNNDLSVYVSEVARERDITVVAVPHGDAPYRNALLGPSIIESKIEAREFERHAEDPQALFEGNSTITQYDAVAAPNELRAGTRRREVVDTSVDVLGSPRYNDEWINILSEISPHVTVGTDESTNVVFFMRSESYMFSKRQCRLAIEVIQQLPNVELIVSEHPRAPLFEPDETAWTGPNTTIVREEHPSSSLIDWADIVLDIGTSICNQAIVRRKPVLSMDFLHGNVNTTGYYLESARMESFDDLYLTLADLVSGDMKLPYTDTQRDRFVSEMVTAGMDGDVLARYVDFIREHL